MANQPISATVFASAHPDIVKRTHVSRLLFSVAMLLVGVLVFVFVLGEDHRPPALTMLLMVIGTALVLSGLFCLFWKSKVMVYAPTGSVTKEHSLFFDLKYIDRLREGIEKGSLSAEAGIKSEGSGNVRMDVILSQDNQFVAIQLFQFVPYTYVPITAIYYYIGVEAASWAAFLAECKA